jgi:uncharacterized protein YodC (DUF2158 family)
MSFSFGVTAGTVAEAKEKVAAAVRDFVAVQDAHKRDAPVVEAACTGALDAIEPKEGETVTLTAYGSATCEWFAGRSARVTGSQFNVNAMVVAPAKTE